MDQGQPPVAEGRKFKIGVDYSNPSALSGQAQSGIGAPLDLNDGLTSNEREAMRQLKRENRVLREEREVEWAVARPARSAGRGHITRSPRANSPAPTPARRARRLPRAWRKHVSVSVDAVRLTRSCHPSACEPCAGSLGRSCTGIVSANTSCSNIVAVRDAGTPKAVRAHSHRSRAELIAEAKGALGALRSGEEGASRAAKRTGQAPHRMTSTK